MIGFKLWKRRLACLVALALALLPVPAAAAVQITFYSKELGTSFPHAFVTMDGTPDRGGPRINEDYGFSAKAISPAILMGRVKGVVLTDNTAGYIKGSDRHFTLTLSDTEFDGIMATIERWRSLPQPSYDLNRQNCVHFVADIAASAGMKVDRPKRLMKSPRSFLEAVTVANLAWLEARHAVLHRQPGH